jgi:hypothetical protein
VFFPFRYNWWCPSLPQSRTSLEYVCYISTFSNPKFIHSALQLHMTSDLQELCLDWLTICLFINTIWTIRFGSIGPYILRWSWILNRECRRSNLDVT